MSGVLRSQEDREAAVSAVHYAGRQLPDRPRLAPWLVSVDLGDGRLQLRSAESSHTITHPLLIRVFRSIEPILDGWHTVDDIVASVDFDVLPTTVVFLLKLLQGKSLLQPGARETALDDKERARWSSQLRFLSHFMPNASSAQSALAEASVGVVGSGYLRQAVLSEIAAIGVRRITELREPSTWCREDHSELTSLDLIVACEESPAFAFFQAVNSACLASNTKWLRVAIWGTSAQLGPTVVPNETACFTCLDLRLQTHQQELDGYLACRDQLGRPDARSDEGRLAPFWSAVAGQAALEAIRLLIGFAPPVTIGRFYDFSTVSPVPIPHDVLRVPRCASCGRRRTFAEAWDQDFMPMDLEP